MTANEPLPERLPSWERRLLVGFWLGLVLFGALVEYRSAFMRRRMGDLGCYLRAAWAVRTGGSQLYHITDDNGWHYNYPPLFAILMAPLADPPGKDLANLTGATVGLLAAPGAGPLLATAALPGTYPPVDPGPPPTVPYLPYAVSVGVFYVLSLICLVVALHVLAGALEQTSRRSELARQPVGRRRWWWLRMVPLYVCLPPILHSLMRGQANLVLLALLCGLAAALIRGRSLTAGLCLAGAICLKIYPAFLALVPLWRRDRRCLVGCALGLFVGLVLIPVAALGPAQTLVCYKEQYQVLIAPALGMGTDQSRAEELIQVPATDSQSFLATIHNTLHLDPWTRPLHASAIVRKVHWLLGATFTLMTLLAARRHRTSTGAPVALFVGALTLIMLLLSPVCHTHYFLLAIPAFMGLLAVSWERSDSLLGKGLLCLIGIMEVGFILPLLPACQVLRDCGLMMYAMLGLWLTACISLARLPTQGREDRRQAAEVPGNALKVA
jgi:hypothetical protein